MSEPQDQLLRVFETPRDAEAALHMIMCALDPVLTRARRCAAAHEQDMDWTKKEAAQSMKGLCGVAQSFCHAAVCETGIGISRPFALQSLTSKVGHVALTVDMQMRQGKTLYLLDRTFRQFVMGSRDRYGLSLLGASGDIDNLDMAGRLLQDGFVALTPERARKYLACFPGTGIAAARSAEAMRFFNRPPLHADNLELTPEDMRRMKLTHGKTALAYAALVRPAAAGAPRPAPRR